MNTLLEMGLWVLATCGYFKAVYDGYRLVTERMLREPDKN